MPDTSRDQHWHLDKKVPVLIILTIVGQSLALGWWASSLDNRVTNLEQYMAESKQVGTSDRLVRLETLMSEIHRSLRNIERQLMGDQRDRAGPQGGGTG